MCFILPCFPCLLFLSSAESPLSRNYVPKSVRSDGFRAGTLRVMMHLDPLCKAARSAPSEEGQCHVEACFGVSDTIAALGQQDW